MTYSMVTFGRPATRLPETVASLPRAIELADEALGTGTCANAKVYECETEGLARTADISTVRAGERVVYTA